MTAANSPVHYNWLNFISHCIRTSIINDTLDRVKKHIETKYGTRISLNHDVWTKLLADLMDPSKRGKIYVNWANELIELFPNELHRKLINKIAIIEIWPEYLFYTHIGRPDLIKFECYK